MLIEVRNYNTQVAKGSLQASFDLILRDMGIIIRECKHFKGQEGKEFIIMPSKANKQPDGTWGKSIPYFDFLNKEMFYQIQKSAITEINKILQPQESLQYPHGLVKPQEPEQPKHQQTNFFDNCPF
jgi:DNA-binding cell septation regulator SpoVG